MKVGDLVKRKRFSRKRRFHTTIYVITEVYRSSVYNNSYTLFTISQASENLRVYKKDLTLLEDTL